MRENSRVGAIVVVITGGATSVSWKGMMCGVVSERSVVVDDGLCKVSESIRTCDVAYVSCKGMICGVVFEGNGMEDCGLYKVGEGVGI